MQKWDGSTLFLVSSYHFHGRKLKISKILNFKNSNFKTCRMITKTNNLKLLKMIKRVEIIHKTSQRTNYNFPNSAF